VLRLDVFEEEPLPRSSPLSFTCDYAALCGFIANLWERTWRRSRQSPLSGGHPLVGLVDKTLGY